MNISPSNRFGFDYREKAKFFEKFSFPLIDIHSHIHGMNAAKLFQEATKLYGIGTVYSMTMLEEAPLIKNILGESIKFIAMHDFASKDKVNAFTAGYLPRIKEYKKLGARIAKFWNAPRLYESSDEPFSRNPFRLNAPGRLDTMKAAADLGMILMFHVSDPDTWFATNYKNTVRYGTKRDQYEPFREVLAEIKTPVIAAHMGGSAEDLDFLDQLLEENSHLYLDTSAAKWVVRELSKHPRERVQRFFMQWQDRLLFGSDIVTSDKHFSSEDNSTEMWSKASNQDEAFDLYASRYYVLRMLFESDSESKSPVADPDLAKVDPSRYTPLDAPLLRGMNISRDVLKKVYHDNSLRLLPD